MDYFCGDYGELSSVENGNSFNKTNNFMVDDLLDFSNQDETITDVFFDTSADSSTFETSNSSVSATFNHSHFPPNELSVPYDDLAELEWLSNFVEESFSTDDIHFIPNATPSVPTLSADASSSAVTTHSPPSFPTDVSVPGKARSKRSRAAPCDWSSRLQVVKKSETPGRKCLHCASEKTPQWRTGPMGPKTLCNACGVRYKSGRLVPEYRPAASPSFVSAKHSNSHRKVMELRRQSDLQRQHQMINHASIFNGCDEFLMHHDMRHMI